MSLICLRHEDNGREHNIGHFAVDNLLADVEIRERIQYDEAHLRGMIKVNSDRQTSTDTASCCCGKPDDAQTIGDLAAACAGKVWSAMIFARKPG